MWWNQNVIELLFMSLRGCNNILRNNILYEYQLHNLNFVNKINVDKSPQERKGKS